MKEAELSSSSLWKKKRRPSPSSSNNNNNNNNNQNYASMKTATATALEVEDEPEQEQEEEQPEETVSLLSSIHDDDDDDQGGSHQEQEEKRRSQNGRPTVTPATLADDNDKADNDRHYYYSLLFPLCIVSFMDAISFMVVAPSLIFIVVDTLHGNKEWYGMIMSSFSLASFITKPILGYVCDHYDNFRLPYLISAGIATIGGLVYFYASNVVMPTSTTNNHHDDTNRIGLWLLLLGRCLGGIGSANSTLGFTYIAKVVPEQDMTQANAFLSMMRVIGMTLAPASFAILARVPPTTVSLGHILGSFQIDSLNSVGLLLAGCNALEWVVLYCFLQEPPIERVKAIQAARHMNSQSFRHNNNGNNTSMRGSGIGIGGLHHHDETMKKKTTDWRKTWEFIQACFCFEILLFVFGILCLNSNFQLLETSLAPASNDALGWGPVQVSMLFGANAVFLLLIIAYTFYLSSVGVDDFDLLLVGLILSVISYLLLYGWWQRGTAPWKFVTPVMLSTGAFPFLGAPTRSLYTKVVAAKSRLRNHQGTMQAVLSMAASVSGFLAPGLIAAFVLRTPDQVSASRHGRELAPGALAAPLSSLIVLIGVVYLRRHPVFQVRQDGTIRSLVVHGGGAHHHHHHPHHHHDNTSTHADVAPGPTTTTTTATTDNNTTANESTTLLVDLESCHSAATTDSDNDDDNSSSESSLVVLPHVFEPSTEAHRRDSSIIMGIPQFEWYEAATPDQSQRKSIR